MSKPITPSAYRATHAHDSLLAVVDECCGDDVPAAIAALTSALAAVALDAFGGDRRPAEKFLEVAIPSFDDGFDIAEALAAREKKKKMAAERRS